MSAFIHSPDFLAYVCGMAAFVVVFLIWKALMDDNRLEARLRVVSERRRELGEKMREKPGRREKEQARKIGVMLTILRIFRLGGKPKKQKKPEQAAKNVALKHKLMQAGIRGRDAVTVFLFTKLAMMLGFGAGAFFFVFVIHAIKVKATILGVLIILFVALLGWALPGVLLKNKIQKRADTLRKSIPDALDLMVICAEAGLSMDSSFDRVSREIANTTPELAEEFGLTSVELGLLPDRAQALQNLALRVDLPGVLALVNTLIQTERFGTPLAQALRILSSEMRDERMMKAEEKAARLPAIMTVPMIIFILPTLFIVLLGPAAIRVMGMMGKH